MKNDMKIFSQLLCHNFLQVMLSLRPVLHSTLMRKHVRQGNLNPMDKRNSYCLATYQSQCRPNQKGNIVDEVNHALHWSTLLSYPSATYTMLLDDIGSSFILT